jgi:hypothetical protein
MASSESYFFCKPYCAKFSCYHIHSPSGVKVCSASVIYQNKIFMSSVIFYVLLPFRFCLLGFGGVGCHFLEAGKAFAVGQVRSTYKRKYKVWNTGPARRLASRVSFVGDGSFRGCPVRAHFLRNETLDSLSTLSLQVLNL